MKSLIISISVTSRNCLANLAYALTDYKCQGKTYCNAIIDLRAPPGAQTDPHSPYVLLSRLKSMDGLLILRSFDLDVFNKPLSPQLLAQLAKEEMASHPT